MRRKVILSIVVAGMVLGMVSMLAFAGGDKGNGAPSGPHENINIIGVNDPKNDNYTGGNGSTIFVSRTGSTQFYVHGGNSFAILDHDGTDGKVGTGLTDPGLIFPYDVSTGRWQVEIWVRLVGPKDSSIDWTSAYWDGSTYLQFATFSLDKSSKFSLRTSQLLLDGYQDILWTLDPVTKFRNLQMRIFLVER